MIGYAPFLGQVRITRRGLGQETVPERMIARLENLANQLPEGPRLAALEKVSECRELEELVRSLYPSPGWKDAAATSDRCIKELSDQIDREIARLQAPPVQQQPTVGPAQSTLPEAQQTVRELREPEGTPVLQTLWYVLGTASMAASAYHGYKRNDSVGWAIWWAFMGALFPVITPTIAIAQGFGKRAKKS